MDKIRGNVTLVGAGPGDKGLLTIKGMEAIQNAEVVVYDRLVGEDILALIPQNAEKINAGKKSGNHTIPQNRINEILLEKALQGKRVVRLKGGDCFLFGRGAEELELLKQNNVDFCVVPGVTSALAVPAYGGIPVTHRDFASSVHIITGHRRENKLLKIDFENCVKADGTLVFLMGIESLPQIVSGLINAGMAADMPCAVIQYGTLPKQKKVVSQLNKIVDSCNAEGIGSPAVIIVGRVCSLDFDWFSSLPLNGKTVVVTRPKKRAGTLSDLLRKKGAEVLEFPCIETVGTIEDNIFEELKNYNWLVFTSPFGVKVVFEKMRSLRLDMRKFGNHKIAVIGSGTAKQLEEYGLFADLMPQKFDGDSLGKCLTATLAKNDKVLILRTADIGGKELPEHLKNAGIEYCDMPVYKTLFVDNKDSAYITERIENGDVDFVAFTSSSAVKSFSKQVKSLDFTAVCIGEKTQKTAIECGMKTAVCKKAEIIHLAKLIEELAGGR